jgi:hypothetical protein
MECAGTFVLGDSRLGLAVVMARWCNPRPILGVRGTDPDDDVWRWARDALFLTTNWRCDFLEDVESRDIDRFIEDVESARGNSGGVAFASFSLVRLGDETRGLSLLDIVMADGVTETVWRGDCTRACGRGAKLGCVRSLPGL